VLVEGEIWRAVANEPASSGALLRVVGHQQYLLRVEPLKGTDPDRMDLNPANPDRTDLANAHG
jgi:membrane-bound ClpP family serine protease